MLQIDSIPPTLRSIGLNAISLELWKQPDIVSELRQFHEGSTMDLFFPRSKRRTWSKIRRKFVEKLSRLSLPELLKEEVKEPSELIGLRITAWLEQVIMILLQTNIPFYIHSIRLDSDGRIDRKKTAASILNAVPNMDPYHRYRLACVNCLEDEVLSLWQELPVEEKNKLLGIDRMLTRKEHIRRYIREDVNDINDIVIYWSCYISQDFDFLYAIIESKRGGNIDIKNYFIRHSIYRSNIVVFKYFWEMLSEGEKRKNLVEHAVALTNWIDNRIVTNNNESGNLVGDFMDFCKYLGSEMDEVQFKEMVQHDPQVAMNFWCRREFCHQGFISWDYLMNFFSPNEYCLFILRFSLHRLKYADKYEFSVRNDSRMFRELWANTPNNFQQRFFKNFTDIGLILSSLRVTVDVENLQFIFDESTVDERKIMERCLSRESFVTILEECRFRGRRTEEEIDDYLQNIQDAFNRKGVKGDLWPLLNNLQK